MAIRRRESEAEERQDGDTDGSGSGPPAGARRRARPRVAVVLAGLLTLAAAASSAADESAPDEAAAPAAAEVPAPLGADAAHLRQQFGASLRPVEAQRASSVFQQLAPVTSPRPPAPEAAEDEPDSDVEPPPGPAQVRLVRPARGEVARVEYDLAGGRVYRVRWQLTERFERPVLGAAVARITARLGRPDYDQTLRAELGSERADLRRVGWTLGPRKLELRQLHPFTGGPVFLSLSDTAAMQAIVDAQGVPLPQPETTGAWWRRPQRDPRLPTRDERETLATAIDALAARLADAGP